MSNAEDVSRVTYKNQLGTVRWVGTDENWGQKNAKWYGVDFDEAIDNGHDGFFNKQRHFGCAAKHGLYLLKKDIEFVKNDTKTNSSDDQKEANEKNNEKNNNKNQNKSKNEKTEAEKNKNKQNTEITENLTALFDISQFRRQKALDLLMKILSKIKENPTEKKLQSLNFVKIQQKFNKNQGGKNAFNLLILAGFKHKKDDERLILSVSVSESNESTSFASLILVLDRLTAKIQSENEILEAKKKEVIAQNNKRLNTKKSQKEKETRNKVLLRHKEQMDLAKKGVYNIGASVTDRKGGGGNQPKTLGL